MPENLGKFSENLNKNPENLDRIPENPYKNGAQRCLTSKIRAHRLQKNTRRPFFGGYIKEVLVIIVGENL